MTGRRRNPIVVDLTSDHDDHAGEVRSKVSKNRVIDLTADDNQSTSSYADDDDSVLNVIAGNPITAYHQEILQTGAWLNDEIINSYLAIITGDDDGIHALSSHFHTKFMREGAAAMTRWMKDLNLPNRRLVLVPINLNGNHWAMVVYHGGAAPKVCLYDSMMGSRSRGSVILQKYAELFEGQLQLHDKPKEPKNINKSQTQSKKSESSAVGLAAYLMTKLSLSSSPPKEQPTESSSRRIAMEIPAGQPQQTDGSSCGVFVCKWAQVLAEKQPPSFSQAQVTRFRRTILDALLTYKQPS